MRQYEQRVIDLYWRQPEFTETLANYLNRRITTVIAIEKGLRNDAQASRSPAAGGAWSTACSRSTS